MARSKPNIIVTGTPGVGKTSHCDILAQNTGLKHLVVNDIVKERGCDDGWDDKLRTLIVDEDKLLDSIEVEMLDGGCIVDWHACDLFPQSWVDLVVVIRCDSTLLYDRLVGRGYEGKKLEENLDAEIMQVLLDEAKDAFDEEIVIELKSDSLEDIDENVARIIEWVKAWKREHSKSESKV